MYERNNMEHVKNFQCQTCKELLSKSEIKKHVCEVKVEEIEPQFLCDGGKSCVKKLGGYDFYGDYESHNAKPYPKKNILHFGTYTFCCQTCLNKYLESIIDFRIRTFVEKKKKTKKFLGLF